VYIVPWVLDNVYLTICVPNKTATMWNIGTLNRNTSIRGRIPICVIKE